VVNACWGAQPAANQRALPRSLAEVLIHHGIPAVLGCVTRLLIKKPLASFKPLSFAIAAAD